MRSWLGHSFLATSTDEGTTWSAPRPSGVIAPDAPTYLCRLPDSDTLLTAWNSNWNPDCGHDVTRCPLLFATSEDGGASWHPPKAIETDPDYEWAPVSSFTRITRCFIISVATGKNADNGK